jgi:MFS family permease
LMTAISSLSSALFCLPASGLGHRWGYRRAMIMGMVLLIAGYGSLPLAEFVPRGWQSGWILVTYLLSGLGQVLHMVSVTPSLTAASTPTERSHVFSIRVALMPVAGFAGSLVGGLLPGFFASVLGVPLDDPAPYRYPLWIGALLISPSLFVLWATDQVQQEADEESATSDEPNRGREATVAQSGRPGPRARRRAFPFGVGRSAPVGLILLLSLVSFLRVSGEGGPRTFLNVYLDTDLGIPVAQIGVLMGVGRLLAIVAALVTPVLISRIGGGYTIVLGAVGASLGLLPLALIPHWAAAGVGFMLLNVLASVSRSAFIVYSQEAVPPRWRVTISATTTMAASISRTLIGFGGGYLVQSIGYRGLFGIGASMTMAGAALFWIRFCLPSTGSSRGPIASWWSAGRLRALFRGRGEEEETAK